MRAETREAIALRERVLHRVRQVLVEELSVRLKADEIDPDAPLFGIGIGLDSVDAIELAVAVETSFGVVLPEGEEAGRVTRSVNRIVDFVVANHASGAAGAEVMR